MIESLLADVMRIKGEIDAEKASERQRKAKELMLAKERGILYTWGNQTTEINGEIVRKVH